MSCYGKSSEIIRLAEENLVLAVSSCSSIFTSSCSNQDHHMGFNSRKILDLHSSSIETDRPYCNIFFKFKSIKFRNSKIQVS